MLLWGDARAVVAAENEKEIQSRDSKKYIAK